MLSMELKVIEMNQNEAIENVKNLIEELFRTYTIMPDSDNKSKLGYIIVMLKRQLPLKMILNQISKYINDVVSVSYNDKTKRESDRKFWNYILNIFISHIPSSKKYIDND
jgi:hypothetical protein